MRLGAASHVPNDEHSWANLFETIVCFSECVVRVLRMQDASTSVCLPAPASIRHMRTLIFSNFHGAVHLPLSSFFVEGRYGRRYVTGALPNTLLRFIQWLSGKPR